MAASSIWSAPRAVPSAPIWSPIACRAPPLRRRRRYARNAERKAPLSHGCGPQGLTLGPHQKCLQAIRLERGAEAEQIDRAEIVIGVGRVGVLLIGAQFRLG